ncbi:hypothetical protein DFJ63DRAFT_111424 [Scheffersomyces coipomensis]|uniref:uncharacterized protein n=1 Tax=Scheffersomyces coipomensis TaxID=1788519 RepID=UPI00315C7815
MTFELLALRKDWFYHHEEQELRFAGLMKIINKAYDKARFKYGIIETTRIKYPNAIPADLQLSTVDGFALFILLGPEKAFQELKEKHNYTRDFSTVSSNLEQSFNCDIPEQYLSSFDLNNLNDVKITIVDNDFELDDKTTNRVLGSAGFRIYAHGNKDDSILDLELTAFTSYMRKLGPKILNLIIDKCLLNEKLLSKLYPTLGPLEQYNKIIIHADVIKEHGLVQYYVNNCTFQQADKKDIFYEVSEDKKVKSEGTLEEGILATRSFTISFIYREILLK